MTIFTTQNLLKAYYNCRQNKRQTVNALKFEQNLEENIENLRLKLCWQTYKPGRSICFIVTKPKPREIFAAEFTDRVVHHLLVNELQNYFEKHIFIGNSFACRPCKGNLFATKQIYKFCQKFEEYYGQFDLVNFFASISKNALFYIVKKHICNMPRHNIWKKEILWISKLIIYHDPTKNYYYKGDPNLGKLVPPHKSLFNQKENIGLPIGNLTSQFFANVLLNELDQFATTALGLQGYGRYVDDFIIFANRKSEIITAKKAISKFLDFQLNLKIHPKKQQIQPTRHGIPFVGYFIKPWVIYPRRNTVKTIKGRLFDIQKGGVKIEDLKATQQTLNSYYGHFRHASSYNLRKHLYLKHFDQPLKLLLAPKNSNYTSYSIIDRGSKK